jgi:hypothetical protein
VAAQRLSVAAAADSELLHRLDSELELPADSGLPPAEDSGPLVERDSGLPRKQDSGHPEQQAEQHFVLKRGVSGARRREASEAQMQLSGRPPKRSEESGQQAQPP